MELSDAVSARRMVRSYDPGRPVPAAVLDRLLDAVTRAPSAGGAQGLDVVVLRSAPDREAFWGTARAPRGDRDLTGAGDDHWLAGMRTAPLLLVLVTDPGAYAHRYAAPDKARAAAEAAAAGGAAPSPWWDVDAGMAAVLVLLTAVDAGLGACFFGVPPPRHGAVLDALDVPPGRRLVGVVSVGTPAPHPTRPPRAPGSRSLHRPARRGAADVAHDGRFGAPLARRATGPMTEGARGGPP